MTTELKPCPCCGGEAKMEELYGDYSVECQNVECLLATPWCGTPEGAAAIWNRRDGEDKIRQELLELQGSYVNVLYSHQHKCRLCNEDYEIFIKAHPEWKDKEAEHE